MRGFRLILVSSFLGLLVGWCIGVSRALQDPLYPVSFVEDELFSVETDFHSGERSPVYTQDFDRMSLWKKLKRARRWHFRIRFKVDKGIETRERFGLAVGQSNGYVIVPTVKDGDWFVSEPMLMVGDRRSRRFGGVYLITREERFLISPVTENTPDGQYGLKSFPSKSFQELWE